MIDETNKLSWVERCLAPFPPEAIGTLPKTAKRPALSYVGHALVTRRLIDADPCWTWEPFAVDPDYGLPRISYRQSGADRETGEAIYTAVMWARLTIGGVTRPCVGTVEGTAAEIEKELISDMLRNGAMRFGIALDLWAKEDTAAAVVREPGPPWWETYGWDSSDQHDGRHDAVLRRMRALPERHLIEAKRAFYQMTWTRPETGVDVPLWVPMSERQVDGKGTLAKTVPREVMEQAEAWLEAHADSAEAERTGEEPFDTEPSPARPTLTQLDELLADAGMTRDDLLPHLEERWGAEVAEAAARDWTAWAADVDNIARLVVVLDWLRMEAARIDAEVGR